MRNWSSRNVAVMCYICFQVETQSWKNESDIQLIAVRMVPSNERSPQGLKVHYISSRYVLFFTAEYFPSPR